MEGIDVENCFCEGIDDLVDLTRKIDRILIRIWRWRLMLGGIEDRPQGLDGLYNGHEGFPVAGIWFSMSLKTSSWTVRR